MTFYFLRLLRFLLSFFFVTTMGSRKWCACCSCSAVTILRYIAIGSQCRLFTFMPLGVLGNGVLLVLFLFWDSRSRYCDISLLGSSADSSHSTVGPADFYLLSPANSYLDAEAYEYLR
ncbi:uncharacterized protein BJ212DRAFT_245720 [Suillus subaureus]|uniref:Uncharacterized protein n=1 Tax=Suillus subaureus TaxID=48587 RepID=A0A9P7J0A2_9AGAM|nr:uncharacterized protein BJ212DRAFT_245720 [Suillus subaureus]KAG1798027.1 hypothetical protein BJ212DRAFT_245720 [Suillus subaureus]